MNGNKNPEKAKRWYESAQDELDSGAILMMHKKHYHACFHARQAVLQALKAAWNLKNNEPGDKAGSELIRQLPQVDNETFLKLEKYIDVVEKIDRFDSPGIPPGKEFDNKDSEFFIDTAYKVLAEVKTII
jgi:HEPN domain-containing protein